MSAFTDFVNTELPLRTNISGLPTASNYPRFTGVGRAVEERTPANVLSDISAAAAADLTSHTGDTSNPHTVTAAQVGNGTAQWNADKLQDNAIQDVTLGVGEDGYVLKWVNASAELQWAAESGGGVTDHGALTGLADDDHTQYLLAAGTRPLSANWDAGSFSITAETLASDVATGTAPLTVASTTVVANLNADLLDGNEAAAFAAASHTHNTSDINAGTLVHERGGLEADVSAYSGLVKIAAGATSAVAAPAGEVVGTTDTQTLTNKTFGDDVRLNGDVLDDAGASVLRNEQIGIDEKCWHIPNPVAADEFCIVLVEDKCTLVKVSAETDTGTVDLNIEKRAFGSGESAGTDLMAADLQATDAGATQTSFASTVDGTVTAQWIVLTVTSVASSPTDLKVNMKFKRWA